jgi:hypothetical protein
MHHRLKLAASGALLAFILAPAGALASASLPTVSVRIEGPTKTLLARKSVKPGSGSITNGGTPPGKCSASSAAGALDQATHGKWVGMYYASVGNGGIFVDSIFGVKPSNSNDYWTVFVNDRTSNLGICEIKPKQGEQLLFAITDGKQYPIVLKGPSQIRVGGTATIKAGYYAKSKFKPLSNLPITGSGVNVTTNPKGDATVKIAKAGTLVLRAQKTGFIRAAPLKIRELP